MPSPILTMASVGLGTAIEGLGDAVAGLIPGASALAGFLEIITAACAL